MILRLAIAPLYNRFIAARKWLATHRECMYNLHKKYTWRDNNVAKGGNMQNTGTIVAVVLIVVLLLVLLSGAGMMGMAGLGMMGPGMMGGYGYGGWGMFAGIVSLLFTLLTIGGIVLVAVWFARSAGKTTLVAGSESPLDILKRRYAKGEISKEQFEQMKRDLGD